MTNPSSAQNQNYSSAPYVPPQARGAAALAPVAHNAEYVSIFQRANSFEEMYRMAELFARSSFVPGGGASSFQNNPSNCLIAMDIAFRLGLMPTAIFPHLYVISGRPALSAQFMIALVNRSGKFTRIQWEEGVDGEVECSLDGRRYKAPNYYATAFFTEFATGETFYSTRVDVELARANGWLSKNQSKWQTIPREMCRWRAASFLAKNYCPELILGLEFADEVADYDAEAPRPTRRTRRAAVANDTIDVEFADSDASEEEARVEKELADAFAAATSTEELLRLGAKVAAADIDDAAKARLRKAYAQRNVELGVPKPAAKPSPVSPQPDEAKPPRKSTGKKRQAEPPAPQDGVAAMIQAIQGATSPEQLRTVYDALQATAQNGEIDADEYQRISDAIEARSFDFEQSQSDEEPSDDAQELEDLTDVQREREEKLLAQIETAKNRDEIDKCFKLIARCEEGGFMTKSQCARAQAAAEKKSQLLLA